MARTPSPWLTSRRTSSWDWAPCGSAARSRIRFGGDVMMLPEEGYLLRIFIGESDRHDGKLLYERIVLKAREAGLAGATVMRGMMGFGAHRRLHTFKIERLSQDLLIIVEIVDTRDKLESFLAVIDNEIEEGMATLEENKIHFDRSGAVAR